MTFRPGSAKPATSGRKPGTPNRSTREVRAALIAAFDELGGVDWLVELGRAYPETFARLLARVVPVEVAAKLETESVVEIIDLSGGKGAQR